MTWIIFIILITLGVLGLFAYNVRTLIRKWKHNKDRWFDLLVGILIWSFGAGSIVWIVIKYTLDNLPQ